MESVSFCVAYWLLPDDTLFDEKPMMALYDDQKIYVEGLIKFFATVVGHSNR